MWKPTRIETHSYRYKTHTIVRIKKKKKNESDICIITIIMNRGNLKCYIFIVFEYDNSKIPFFFPNWVCCKLCRYK